ncbi:MAG: GNAT family N-acetyltransferase [Planctomycetales bacterium]|nr:GNAT family N-acetyltransferase [Planctomycetales bacterium]
MSYAVTCPNDVHEIKDVLFDLWNRNFDRNWCDWYDWMFEGNPYGPVSNWLVETDRGEVVGSTGLMPRDMRIGNRMRRVGQAIHINVNKEHRTASPALQLQRALTNTVRENGMALVCGVTETAVAVFQRAGYRLLGNVERWIKPLHTEYKLRNRIRNTFVRKLASWSIDQGLRLRSAETYYRRQPGHKVEITDSFDERFDRLWETVAPMFPILGDRTRTFLDWRFSQKPKTECRVMSASDSHGNLTGYLVFSSFRDTRDNVDYLGIHDVVYADAGVLHTLLAEFCRHAHSTTAHAVSLLYFGNDRVTAALRRFGFFQRPYTWKVLVYANPTEPGDEKQMLLDRGNWHLTEAELQL